MKRRPRDPFAGQSFGAASEVRHIDPATYQPSEAPNILQPVRQDKTVTLLNEADKILLRDAYARHGKRYRDKVRNKIMAGRY